MKDKKILLVLETGDQYTVDLLEVAKDRVNYYLNYANTPDFNVEEELDFVLSDDFEGIDWLQNDMNWWECKSLSHYKSPSRELGDLEIEGIEIFDAKDFQHN